MNVKIKKLKIIILFFSVLLLTLLAKNDYCIYHDTIATITDVSNEKLTDMNNQETSYRQTITLLVRNGTDKGTYHTVKNEYNESQLNTTKFKKGNDVFISLKGDNTTILKQKLDVYIVFLASLFLALLFFIAKRLGILVVLSLVMNVFLFKAALSNIIDTSSIGIVSAILILLFIVLTLIILNGFTMKSLGSILSSLVTVFIIQIIYTVVYHHAEPPAFECMNYIIGNEELDQLFSASVIIGALGAIMDISITIHSAVAEIINTSEKIKMSELIRSIRQIGYDIMGTMISVLFFSNMSQNIMMLVVKIKNGYTFANILKYDLIFDYIRFIIGSIGIVLAIPISGVTAIFVFQIGMKRLKRERQV